MALQHEDTLAAQLESGQRFPFGKNWAQFLKTLDEQKIQEAERSLCKMLRVNDLSGRRFLDVGSGSGLSSLAARRLGAQVHSFDYDPESVACTLQLRRRYFPDDPHWTIERGSILDAQFVTSLGRFDIVYSWGVLHHTGEMYKALSEIAPCVAAQGMLFVAIYNDQGWISRYWMHVKRAYNRSRIERALVVAVHAPYLLWLRWVVRTISGRGSLQRGMSLSRDMFDWLGGYPFEVAKPEEIFRFYRDMGFSLETLKTCGGRQGCNEFVFHRETAK